MTNYKLNQSVSSLARLNQEPIKKENDETILIEGKIIRVMESWPLQLMVENLKSYHFSLKIWRFLVC
jgi:hypothetical protein